MTPDKFFHVCGSHPVGSSANPLRSNASLDSCLLQRSRYQDEAARDQSRRVRVRLSSLPWLRINVRREAWRHDLFHRSGQGAGRMP